ncbi:MAG: glycosyltransferase family 1 protein, partial [Verrucomicrobiaceae bacterium]
MRTAFISIVPSPYQRDLFGALAERPEVDLSVFYLEATAPDSPWPEKALAPYEKKLPGFWFPLGNARIHVNWPLPSLHSFDVVVLNTLMSLTGQWLMRGPLRRRR